METDHGYSGFYASKWIGGSESPGSCSRIQGGHNWCVRNGNRCESNSTSGVFSPSFIDASEADYEYRAPTYGHDNHSSCSGKCGNGLVHDLDGSLLGPDQA